jgi:hypothetical protein
LSRVSLRWHRDLVCHQVSFHPPYKTTEATVDRPVTVYASYSHYALTMLPQSRVLDLRLALGSIADLTRIVYHVKRRQCCGNGKVNHNYNLHGLHKHSLSDTRALVANRKWHPMSRLRPGTSEQKPTGVTAAIATE